jgi:hypothetical protein
MKLVLYCTVTLKSRPSGSIVMRVICTPGSPDAAVAGVTMSNSAAMSMMANVFRPGIITPRTSIDFPFIAFRGYKAFQATPTGTRK